MLTLMPLSHSVLNTHPTDPDTHLSHAHARALSTLHLFFPYPPLPLSLFTSLAPFFLNTCPHTHTHTRISNSLSTISLSRAITFCFFYSTSPHSLLTLLTLVTPHKHTTIFYHPLCLSLSIFLLNLQLRYKFMRAIKIASSTARPSPGGFITAQAGDKPGIFWFSFILRRRRNSALVSKNTPNAKKLSQNSFDNNKAFFC